MATGDILDIVRFLKDSGIKEDNISFASRDEDIMEHWDFEVKLKEGSKRIDIKSLKRLNRHDEEFNDELHWVELKNVHGDLGWVRGKADFILFECFDVWLLVDRSRLEQYVLGKTANGSIITTKDFELLQKGYLYQRKDRKDEMTLLKKEELLNLNPKRINKKVKYIPSNRISQFNSDKNNGLVDEAVVINYLTELANKSSENIVVRPSSSDENIKYDIDVWSNNIAYSIKCYQTTTPLNFQVELEKMDRYGKWRKSWYYNGKSDIYLVWHKYIATLFKINKKDVVEYVDKYGFDSTGKLKDETSKSQVEGKHADVDVKNGYINFDILVKMGIAKILHTNFNVYADNFNKVSPKIFI
jgi:hypothetical protein